MAISASSTSRRAWFCNCRSADLRLLHLQLVARQVGLGDAIVDRQRHLHADAVGGILAREDLVERAAVAAADSRGRRSARQRIGRPARPLFCMMPTRSTSG